MKTTLRVLVIAHNTFAASTNMGKTLLSYFDMWEGDHVGELYFHAEIPTCRQFSHYFRVTDSDVLKSILFRNSCGKVFQPQEVEPDRITPRADGGILKKVYNRGRRRTPMTYILRNLVWTLGAWESPDMNAWIEEFAPDVIFFASGDYSFAYRVALRLSKKRNIPLVVCCVDDYYLHNRNASSLLGCWQHKRFMKVVGETMERASCIMTINDKMSREYTALFGKKCYTLYTGTEQKIPPLPDEEKEGISYLGNLSFDRNHQLVDVGRALKRLSTPEKSLWLDVYSGEKDPEILKVLTPENGIRFHGAVSAERVSEIIAKSLAIIHTEAFDEENKQRVMYSTSTKIAESLASGTCLIAYGPAEVASMEYLIENDAAVVITAPEQLEEKLRSVLADAGLRKGVTANALKLAEKNHRLELVSQTVRTAVEEACGKGKV